MSESAARYLRRLSDSERERITRVLRALEDQPRRRRPGADIKKLAGTSPPKYRLRIGAYRAVYAVQGGAVRVLDIFRRGRGYR